MIVKVSGDDGQVVTDKAAYAVAVGHGELDKMPECPCHGIAASLEITFLSLCRAHDAGDFTCHTGLLCNDCLHVELFLMIDTLDCLDLVAGLGILHLHALARPFLLIFLLPLLVIVFRGGLSFLQRFFQVLGRLVGLALVVHGHLRAALVAWGDLLRVVGIGVVAVRASLFRV